MTPTAISRSCGSLGRLKSGTRVYRHQIPARHRPRLRQPRHRPGRRAPHRSPRHPPAPRRRASPPPPPPTSSPAPPPPASPWPSPRTGTRCQATSGRTGNEHPQHARTSQLNNRRGHRIKKYPEVKGTRDDCHRESRALGGRPSKEDLEHFGVFATGTTRAGRSRSGATGPSSMWRRTRMAGSPGSSTGSGTSSPLPGLARTRPRDPCPHPQRSPRPALPGRNRGHDSNWIRPVDPPSRCPPGASFTYPLPGDAVDRGT